ncbi:hypothetical protein EV363DRAFT_1444744 [Boletus edulis]|nr:hypothetical protein EV363DRAFT_1444744 [Boletus edulis]
MPRSDFSVDTASYDSAAADDEYRLAQKEWQESLEELQQLALVLLLPWLGKFLGRKTSHCVRPLPPSRSRIDVPLWRQTARIPSISR